MSTGWGAGQVPREWQLPDAVGSRQDPAVVYQGPSAGVVPIAIGGVLQGDLPGPAVGRRFFTSNHPSHRRRVSGDPTTEGYEKRKGLESRKQRPTQCKLHLLHSEPPNRKPLF